MSQLQVLGKNLDQLLQGIKKTLPHLEPQIFNIIHPLFVELISTGTQQQQEQEIVSTLVQRVSTIRSNYRGLLE